MSDLLVLVIVDTVETLVSIRVVKTVWTVPSQTFKFEHHACDQNYDKTKESFALSTETLTELDRTVDDKVLAHFPLNQ